MIKTQHFLKIKLKTKALVADLDLKIPLQIGHAFVPPPLNETEQLELSSSYPDINPSAPMEVAPFPTEVAPVPSAPLEMPSTDDAVPFANAVPLDSSSSCEEEVFYQAPVLQATAFASTISLPTNEDNMGEPLVPMLPPVANAEPSVEALLEQMETSMNDYDIVRRVIDQREWEPVFTRLTPDEYGSIIAHVSSECEVALF